MRLADDYWWLVHDPVSGKPCLNARVAGLGLAAALLAELVFARRMDVRHGRLWVIDPSPPEDVLAHAVLEQLVAHPQHTAVRVWLDFLCADAGTRVAERLWRAGHLRRESSRGLFRRGVRWVPVDWNTACWPGARLSTWVRERRPMSQADVFLSGLAVATGLDSDMFQDLPPASAESLRELISRSAPPLHELLTQTQCAVGESVLTYRT